MGRGLAACELTLCSSLHHLIQSAEQGRGGGTRKTTKAAGAKKSLPSQGGRQVEAIEIARGCGPGAEGQPLVFLRSRRGQVPDSEPKQVNWVHRRQTQVTTTCR